MSKSRCTFNGVTCTFNGVTCTFKSVTRTFNGVTCTFNGVTCTFKGVTCTFNGLTCTFNGVTCTFNGVTCTYKRALLGNIPQITAKFIMFLRPQEVFVTVHIGLRLQSLRCIDTYLTEDVIGTYK